MKNIFIVSIFIAFSISCSDKKQIEKRSVEKSKNETENKPVEIVDNYKLCIDFLSSYQKNYDKIYEKDFVNYDGNFRINFENLNYFIENTQIERFCTKKYVSNFRNKIIEIDKRLKENPQNDGTIDGLEGDPFLLTQDIEETLNQIATKKISCKEIGKNNIEINFGNSFILLFIIDKKKIDNITLKT
jgi:hypothetical protein